MSTNKELREKLLLIGKTIKEVCDALKVPDSIKYRCPFNVIRDLFIEFPEGFTVDIDGNHYCGGGYGVSITNNSSRSFLGAYTSIFRQFDKEYAKGKPVYLGGWISVEPTKVYLDITLIVDDLTTAIHVAEVNDQQAIYDFNTNKTIWLSDLK